MTIDTASTKAPSELAAWLLLEARREGRLATTLPDMAAPRTTSDAYAVQDLVRAELGPTIGWKTGAPSPTAEPIAAPLLQRFCSASPAHLRTRDFNMVGLEAELAFKLGKDLPPTAGPSDPEQVFDAIAGVHAAIEIVDTRLPAWRDATALWKLADNQSNGFFILGSGTEAWREQDLSAAAVRLCVDGQTVVAGNGGNAAGDPLRLLLWLIDHCRRQRGGLRRGDVVTTGTFTGIHFIEAPAKVCVSFAEIGTAEVTFTD